MKKAAGILIIILIIMIGVCFLPGLSVKGNYIEKYDSSPEYSAPWAQTVAKQANKEGLTVYVDELMLSSSVTEKIYMNDNMMLMFTQSALREAFGCAVDFRDESQLILSDGNKVIYVDYGEDFFTVQEKETPIDNKLVLSRGTLYIPLEILIKGFGYRYNWDGESMTSYIATGNPDISAISYYLSPINTSKISYSKNQGDLNACWAFAALSTIEYSLLPDEIWDFSEDNMIYDNSFSLSPEDGGDRLMALSYLTAWQGPVTEESDIYNDGVHPDSAETVKHIQEAQFVQDRDFETIKKFVYKYGAVESSVYISMTSDGAIDEAYYNTDTFSYCCTKDAEVNHEIVIIGWDDDFPSSNFTDASSDGAFICMNSWGSDFGDNGIFYVSYCDVSIGKNAIAYSKIEEPDNYDNIYQYDLCGWNGNIGYDTDTAYFANIFTAQGNEYLCAVSFYASVPNTAYAIFVIPNYDGEEAMNADGKIYAFGSFDAAGYYTVDLDETALLRKGEKFAVIVKIYTPGENHPIAINANAGDARSAAVVLKGCESYISSDGRSWTDTQSEFECNVCLKAFTLNR